MRIILTIAIIVAFSFDLFSQIDKPIAKSNLLFGGETTVSYISNNSNTMSDFTYGTFSASLTPCVAYFVINNLAIGLSVDFSYKSREYYKYYSAGIGPMLRFFLDNGLVFGFTSIANVNDYLLDNNDQNIYITLTPSIGYAWFVNSKISIEPSISYEYERRYHNISEDYSFAAALNTVFFSIGISKFL